MSPLHPCVRLAILAAALGWSACGCSLTGDESIRYTWSNNSNITNGTACDLAAIDSLGIERITVPVGTKVTVGEPPGLIEIVIHKRLGMLAHPPKPISIDEVRRHAGCALRIDWVREITLATIGDATFEGHGGIAVDLEVILPKQIAIHQAKGLHGVEPKADFSGDWTPANSWLRLKDRPSPEHLRAEDPTRQDEDE